MKRLLATMAVVLLAGCAPRVNFTKADFNQAQFDRDVAECQYDANKATATDPNVFAQLMSNNLAMQCMKVRGYSLARGDEMAGARAQAAANEKAHPIAEQKAQQMRDLQAQP